MASGSPPALLPQFEDALEAFTQALTSSEKADFQFTTVTDVQREIERIQKEQEQKHLQRGLKRIWPFVDRLIRYSAVIEQFVTINPGILAPIWGPLKFILQVSKNAKKSFDIIISALTKIGHCLPRFTIFADIFKESPRFSQVLVWLYTDILEFYSQVLKFFRKNRKRTLFLRNTPLRTSCHTFIILIQACNSMNLLTNFHHVQLRSNSSVRCGPSSMTTSNIFLADSRTMLPWSTPKLMPQI
jgi:hypothetical protein